MKKSAVSRPYPPDFVRLKTLAYRLDLSPRTVMDYVAAGFLPPPRQIGNVRLWRWADVERWLAGEPEKEDNPSLEDEYSQGIDHVAPATEKETDDRAA